MHLPDLLTVALAILAVTLLTNRCGAEYPHSQDFPPGYSCFPGISLPGATLDSPLPSSSSETCAQACSSDARCTLFYQNHTSGTCSLKKRLWDHDAGGVTGVPLQAGISCIKASAGGTAPAVAGALCYKGIMISGAVFTKIEAISDLATCVQHCMWYMDCEFAELGMTGDCYLKGEPFRGWHGHNGPDGGVFATCLMAPGAPGRAAAPAPPPVPLSPGYRYAPSFQAQYRPVWEECGGKCLAILGIPSPVSHFAERQWLRQTYQQHSQTPRGIKYLFVITPPRGSVSYNHTQLYLEYGHHRDMLLLNVRERVPGGFRKSFAFFEWAAKVAGVSRAEFWVKSDMDTLLNPYALKHLLLNLPRSRTYWGRFVGPAKNMSMVHNPGFFAGPLYVLSSDLVQYVATESSAAQQKAKHGEVGDVWVEDIRIGALVNETLPVRQWHAAKSCQLIWAPAFKAWDKETNLGNLANCTIAHHHLKSREHWYEYYERMLPAIQAWRQACEPEQSHRQLHGGAHWGSPACHALAERPADCGW